ncbi:SMI1/KNR4 family protein [Burkholderia sp. Ac-20392]|nr:SMI1/KNR4 family protein [Burkholderia sp. Ac-20392]
MSGELRVVIGELIELSGGRRINLPAPDDHLISECENEIGFLFSDDYKYFLTHASTIFFGVLEPLVVTGSKEDRCELTAATQRARQVGLPSDWLPICEDNGDYYCITPDGRVRFWSPDGVTTESWTDLAEWIIEVWLSNR